MVQINISSDQNASKGLGTQAGALSVNLRYLRQLSSILLSVTSSRDGEEPLSLSAAVKSAQEAFLLRNSKLNAVKPSQPIDTKLIREELHEIKSSVDHFDQTISEAIPKLQDTKSKSQKLEKDEL